MKAGPSGGEASGTAEQVPPPSHGILAYEDEPLWSAYAREYVFPGLMFAAMMYFLLMHVAVPMWHVGLPTRRPAESFVAQQAEHREADESASADSTAAEATISAPTASASSATRRRARKDE